MRRKDLCLVASLALGLVLAACGSDGGQKTPTDGAPPASGDGSGTAGFPACTAAIAAKQQEIINKGVATAAEIAAWKISDWEEMVVPDPKSAILAATDGQGKYWEGSPAMSGKYWDDLSVHPGCKPRATYDGNVDIFNAAAWGGTNEATVATGFQAGSAQDKTGLLTGYTCAAKVYNARPEGIDESLPIVVLQHGNSGSPNHFEEYFQAKLAGKDTASGGFNYKCAPQAQKMLATRLVEAGYQVVAPDLRPDLIVTLDGVNLAADVKNSEYGDAVGSIDHGWGTPILQHFLKVLMKNTTKQISILGHSYGYSVVRDALRRIYLEYKAGTYEINPFTRLRDVVLASGTAHGVAGGNKSCAFYVTLRGKCNCQMGDRDSYTATEFNKRCNGPDDLFSVPCADGSFAFGETDQCEGHLVRYTTITMKDIAGGKFQDEFVSEGASMLDLSHCVDNQLISNTNGFDSSCFFLGGALLANHLGSIRSTEGIELILKTLK
jgi:hypothetical protein